VDSAHGGIRHLTHGVDECGGSRTQRGDQPLALGHRTEVGNPSDPQQINGYAYAADNPISESDPTGLCPADLCGNGTPIGGTGVVKGDPTRFVSGASTGNRYDVAPHIASHPSSSGSGGSGGGGGSSSHSCGWLSTCKIASLTHKVTHVIKQHPVIASVVATTIVVGVVIGIGGVGAIGVAAIGEGLTAEVGAKALTAGATAAADSLAWGATPGLAALSGGLAAAAEVGSAARIATVGAAAVSEGAQILEKADAATASAPAARTVSYMVSWSLLWSWGVDGGDGSFRMACGRLLGRCCHLRGCVRRAVG
jgi:hypothetical protein